MDPSCQEFRIEWLSGPRSPVGHPDACAACALWARSVERTRAALQAATPLPAPPELEARVAAELGGDRTRRLERLLESAVRRAAPALLDERVDALLRGSDAARERGSQKARVLHALDVQGAPEVLERLVQEELAEPERHQAERFPGSLERLRAPAALGERVGQAVRRNALSRRVLGPLLALTAAGLVLWLSSPAREEAAPRYRFRVSQAGSLAGLDPMARALAESLGGSLGEVPR